jgi:hypothetical protein
MNVFFTLENALYSFMWMILSLWVHNIEVEKEKEGSLMVQQPQLIDSILKDLHLVGSQVAT